DFTAGLESSLDEIAENNKEWVPLLKSFWDDFNKTILEKSNIDRAEITQEAIHEDCPKCSKPLFSRLGRRGKFIGCSGYPDCDYTRNVNGDSSTPNEPVLVCKDPETEKDVLLLVGPYGPYLQVGIQEEDSKKKPKRVSVPKEISLSDLNEDIALNLLSLPKELGLHPDTGKKVIVNIGRFGPYVNYDGKFKSIPRSESIFDVTLERGLELIAEAIAKNAPLKNLGNDPETNLSVEIFNGRYGKYLQKGSTKVTLPKDQDIEKITFEDALVLISNKEALGKGKKKATVKKTTAKKTSEKKVLAKKSLAKKKLVKTKKA
ncbi:MAG TPA: topoisomerase C-terminal repeat-containing protein, partial [Candidatus Methylopumilus sp.]